MKYYCYQWDFWAILLFAIVMVPNVIWGFFSAPDNVLHVDSMTPHYQHCRFHLVGADAYAFDAFESNRPYA